MTALRHHNVYGPRMPRDTPYAGVAATFRSALERGEAPRVFEDGGQRRDFVHVRDVARANALAVMAEGPAGGLAAYNIASGEPHTVGEMAVAPAKAYGGPDSVVTGEYRLGDVRRIVAAPDRAADELGFRSSISFEDGHAPEPAGPPGAGWGQAGSGPHGFGFRPVGALAVRAAAGRGPDIAGAGSGLREESGGDAASGRVAGTF